MEHPIFIKCQLENMTSELYYGFYKIALFEEGHVVPTNEEVKYLYF